MHERAEQQPLSVHRDVAFAPVDLLGRGDVVATAMGGMGRQFDGGCAEFTCVPATQVQVIKTELA